MQPSSRITMACATILALLTADLARAAVVISYPYSGVTQIDRTETVPRAENMHILMIDLTNPGIHFQLSPANPPSPNTYNSETRVQTTLAYLTQTQAQYAVNTAFFDYPAMGNDGTNLTGFVASMGNAYSAFDSNPTLSYALTPNAPVLNIDAANNAQIAQRGVTSTSLVSGTTAVTPYNAISGSAQIITNGVKTLPTVPAKPGTSPPMYWYTDQITARTAIGLSQDSKTLFLFTVDAAGGSVGMTVDEMATFLQSQYGVYNALNLDGGGSTTMAMADPADHSTRLVNTTSSTPRSVGCNLAIFAAANQPGKIPISNNFDTTPVGATPANFVVGNVGATTNTWSVVAATGGNHLYENSLTAGKGFSSQLTNLGPADPAHNFEVSTLLKPVSAPNASVNYTAGLRFLASGSGTTDNSYVADLNLGVNGGRMRIVEWTGATAGIAPSSTQADQPLIPNFSLSKTYRLDVKGTYDASNALTLTYTVSDVNAPSDFQTYTYIDPTPRTGQYFGLFDSMGSNGGTMTVQFDNFSVVPEPSTLALLGIATLGLPAFAWRRHRAALLPLRHRKSCPQHCN